MKKKTGFYSLIAQNRKARFNYTIIDTLEVGLVLQGSEVKSIRKGKISLQEAYVDFIEGEAYLVNCHVAEYSFSGSYSHQPLRAKKLLLHRKQLQKLSQQVKTKGITVVPLKVYLNNKNLVKVEIGLAKGKDMQDKRSVLKERAAKKEADKELKSFNRRI